MKQSRFKFLEHDGVLAFAHRGGAHEAPENTMKAFSYAVDLGYRYLETDAYSTRDGVREPLNRRTAVTISFR